MRTAEDALRSLARYAAIGLGDAWEVRFSREEGTFERPLALVEEAGATQFRKDTKYLANVNQPFVIYCYPAQGATPDDAVVSAAQCQDLLFRTFEIGVDRGAPGRVPLYDYDGVPLDQGSLARDYPDYMRLTDLTITRRLDPEDTSNTLWTVICEVRLSWRRTTIPTTVGEIAQSVTVGGSGGSESAGQPPPTVPPPSEAWAVE